ncbi:MAG: fasciclin domain-containing protein [Myxococcota bacterium]|nr:fasciclin domain-containing protein [Myxococcota bacterium]
MNECKWVQWPVLVGLVGLFGLLFACGGHAPDVDEWKSVVVESKEPSAWDKLQELDKASLFRARVADHEDWVNILENQKPLTILVPTNDAWRAFEGIVHGLEDEAAETLFKHRLIFGTLSARAAETAEAAKMGSGQTIPMAFSGLEVLIGGTSRISESDIDGGNGFIHLLDSVMLPAAQLKAMDLDQFLDLYPYYVRFKDLWKLGSGTGSLSPVSGEQLALFPAEYKLKRLDENMTADENRDLVLYHLLPGISSLAPELSGENARTSLTGRTVKLFRDSNGFWLVNDSTELVDMNLKLKATRVYLLRAVLVVGVNE